MSYNGILALVQDKEETIDTLDNMDESQMHYTKQKEARIKGLGTT